MRAKQRPRENGIRFDVPAADLLPARLAAILDAAYADVHASLGNLEEARSYLDRGGFDNMSAIDQALQTGGADFVAIGRLFIANPDLIERLKTGQPLAKPDPAKFYAPGPRGFTDGYTDYVTAA